MDYEDMTPQQQAESLLLSAVSLLWWDYEQCEPMPSYAQNIFDRYGALLTRLEGEPASLASFWKTSYEAKHST